MKLLLQLRSALLSLTLLLSLNACSATDEEFVKRIAVATAVGASSGAAAVASNGGSTKDIEKAAAAGALLGLSNGLATPTPVPVIPAPSKP